MDADEISTGWRKDAVWIWQNVACIFRAVTDRHWSGKGGCREVGRTVYSEWRRRILAEVTSSHASATFFISFGMMMGYTTQMATTDSLTGIF